MDTHSQFFVMPAEGSKGTGHKIYLNAIFTFFETATTEHFKTPFLMAPVSVRTNKFLRLSRSYC